MLLINPYAQEERRGCPHRGAPIPLRSTFRRKRLRCFDLAVRALGGRNRRVSCVQNCGAPLLKSNNMLRLRLIWTVECYCYVGTQGEIAAWLDMEAFRKPPIRRFCSIGFRCAWGRRCAGSGATTARHVFYDSTQMFKHRRSMCCVRACGCSSKGPVRYAR